MRQIEYSGQFKRDIKRIKKRGKNMDKIKPPMQFLIENRDLPAVFLDHPLHGSWKGCRDLHIEPDWILIYRLVKNIVRFERTGSHSDLFCLSVSLPVPV
ncbi:MAG: type II toxin-antitoxin system YafQ family toxin [Xanthomonadales bacterium]|nr:type II toxin-antitoxin system YafQ family toxin [Xanthomonadales bacterium]